MEDGHIKLMDEVSDIANSLLVDGYFSSLTEVEALKLAVQIQKNRILSDAYGVTNIHKAPAFLEAIAIMQGFNGVNPVADAIQNLAEKFGDSLECEI